MEKIVIKNKFRVIDAEGNKIRLNTTNDKNGVDRYVEGFSTLAEAQAAKELYCFASGIDAELFSVESYPEQQRITVPIAPKEINKELAKRKLFSGKGLEYNTGLRRRDETRYKPDKFYTREIWFAQSINHNKGASTLPKAKKLKNMGLNDNETFLKIDRYAKGSVIMEDGLLSSLRKKGFANRKALKDYLKPLGFTNRKIESIFHDLSL